MIARGKSMKVAENLLQSSKKLTASHVVCEENLSSNLVGSHDTTLVIEYDFLHITSLTELTEHWALRPYTAYCTSPIDILQVLKMCNSDVNTVFAETCHWTRTWVRWNQSSWETCYFNIHFNIIPESAYNPSSRIMALGPCQRLTEMSTKNLPGVKERPASRRVRLTWPPPVSHYVGNVGASTSHNRMCLDGLLQG
jgi:hypothetical protein